MTAKEARAIALKRLVITAREDALQCDAEALIGNWPKGRSGYPVSEETLDRVAEKVRHALREIASQLSRRIRE
jgi:hypothetical protein